MGFVIEETNGVGNVSKYCRNGIGNERDLMNTCNRLNSPASITWRASLKASNLELPACVR